mmetsp:Transcript_7141/g.26118  ORF Transcript_7141/g.26118 Transcript_7141/m.26118 type:complete len:268 (+) Transcript_7141:65-868(+)
MARAPVGASSRGGPSAAAALLAAWALALAACSCPAALGSAPPEPSAPPPEEWDPADDRTPAFNPESTAGAVNNFLQSKEGRAVLEHVARQLFQKAIQEETQRAITQLRGARNAEQAAFQRQVRRDADAAAQAATTSEVERLHSLVKAVVSTEVRKETERVVPVVVREDPLMKRLLKENLAKVRSEVRAAAAKELAEICNEEKYHRVNKAFLSALELRCQTAIKKTQEEAQSSVRSVQTPIFVAQTLSAAALIAAGVALFKPQRNSVR